MQKNENRLSGMLAVMMMCLAGSVAYAADRPERDAHAAVKEALFLGDGGGDLGLELD